MKLLEHRLRVMSQKAAFTARRLEKTSEELKIATNKVVKLAPVLVTARDDLRAAKAEIGQWKRRHDERYHQLRTLRRQHQRIRVRERAILKTLHHTQSTEIPEIKLKLRNAEDRAARALHKLEEAIATAKSDQQEHKKDMAERHKRINALRKKCARTPRVLMKAIKRAEEKGQIDSGLHLARRIESKGVYTAEARALMRELAKAGCAPSKTGKVIQMVARLAGANYTSKLSRRTVRRAIIEGGVAAKMQLGYEIKMAKGTLPLHHSRSRSDLVKNISRDHELRCDHSPSQEQRSRAYCTCCPGI